MIIGVSNAEVVDGFNKKSFGGIVGKKFDESGCVKRMGIGILEIRRKVEY